MNHAVLVTLIMEVYIKLNHIAGKVDMKREHLQEMEFNLLRLELEDLQKLYVNLAENAIETLQKIDINVQTITNKGMQKLESIERDKDMEVNEMVVLF